MSKDLYNLLNKIQAGKEKKKKFHRIKILEIELVKVEYACNPNKLQTELRVTKIQVINKNLYEIKQGISVDCAGVLEMAGSLIVGDQIRQTHFRIRNISDYEAYINSIDEGYDAEDANFNGFIYKTNTPQKNSVFTSQYGNG